MEVVYHGCKELLVPKGQSPGASGLNQPNPRALQAQHHLLLSCSQARVQSGQSCPSPECEVSTGEEGTLRTRTPQSLVAALRQKPGVAGLLLLRD